MRDIHLWVLAHEAHLFVHGLDTCHVGSRIICQLDLLSAADALCAPVKIAHIYWASNLAGDGMESCLPSLHWLACAFRCESEVYHRSSLHFIDYTDSYIAASLSVDRYAAEFAEEPSERTPEEFTFLHAVRLSAYRYII